MDCREAREALTEPNREGVDEAREHVTACPACLSRFDQLALAILSMDENEISCAECRARLPAYLEAEGETQETPTELSAVADHLARCPTCAAEYRALQATMAAWSADTLPELTSPPAFDLSFLDKKLSAQLARSKGALWLSEAAGRVRELFTEVVVNLEAKAASFGTMPVPLVPAPAPARVFRAEDDGGQAQVLVLPDPDADVSIQVAVGPAADEKAAMALKLNRAASGDPLPDTRIMLYDAERHLLAGSVTEADGSLIFRDLRAGRYIVQVRHHSDRWELPVLIVAR